MTKIFKHLAKHWAACLVIIALLLVQAYGDLTLPDYTSKIVDTGIQQSGIADAVPEVVRDSTLQVLELLMTDADAAAVEAAYTQPGGTDNALSSATSLQKKLASPYTVRLLRADADRDTLAEVFSTPDIVLYLASAQAAGEGNAPDAAALDTVTAQFAAMTQMPGFSRDAVQAQLAAAMGQAGESELSGLSAQAVLLVGLEYQALGISDAVQMNYLMQTGGRMLGLTLLMVAAAVLVGLLASRVAAAIARDLRRGVFRRVVSFSASETDKFSTASLITRTTNDVQQIQMTCVILLRMVAYAPILGIGGIIHVAQAGSSLTWIIVLAVALLLALITVLMQFAMPKFRIMQKLVDRLNLVSREILTGIMPIRAFSREQHEEARFDAANTDLMRTQLFTNRVMAAMMPFMTLIMNGTSLLIVWFGGKQIDAGTMQVGSMIAFITYTMQIVMSFLMLTMVAVMLPRAGVAADRIDEVLTTEPAIHDPVPEAIPADLNQHHWNGEVAFHHVNFTYPGSSEDALHDIDFVAKPGQTTAIIGSTGCGKTSLLHLITRFYDVTGGSVTVDGVETERSVSSEAVLEAAQNRIVAKGTKPTPTPTPKPTPKPTAAPKKTTTATKTARPSKTTKATATAKPKTTPDPNKKNASDVTDNTITVDGKTYTYSKTLTVMITAYTHTGRKTSTGVWPKVGTVAVDKSVIPYGTKLYIPGYGFGVAQDTGVSGNHIDVFFDTEAECTKFGRKRDRTIYILD